MMEKYILTGGPGTGKTTLLSHLSMKGFTTLPEVARQIIAEEQEKETGILPWTNLALFQELVVKRQVEQEKKIIGNQKIFLDRSLADPLAFAEVGKIEIGPYLYDLIEQADYTRVFYLEQLPFYAQDSERKEDVGLARKIHEQLYSVYDRLGFDIVTVPAIGIEERLELILKETRLEKNREIERKYRVEHSQVKEMLGRYAVKYTGTDNEENTLYDFHGILKSLDCVFRIRENDNENILTLKGPNKNPSFTNKPEYNFSIPKPVSIALDAILPASVSYSKRRENYRPLGDARCTISLDYLPQLGQFVEIEAASENQVLLWEKRLGLSEYAINKSYPALVREHEITNPR
ncbi:MAG: AAA family ATPase [Nanoarchaeota archaeon]|nr:AAA family ATPase [Nanoarchaeota archaeon]